MITLGEHMQQKEKKKQAAIIEIEQLKKRIEKRLETPLGIGAGDDITPVSHLVDALHMLEKFVYGEWVSEYNWWEYV